MDQSRLRELFPDVFNPQITGPSSGLQNYVRVGGTQVSAPALGVRSVGQTFRDRLDPNATYRIAGPGALPGTVAVSTGAACDAPTGQVMPVLLPFEQIDPVDSIGQPIAGAPQEGMSVNVTQLHSGNPAIGGQIVGRTSALAARYLSGLVAGEAIALDPYPTYPFTDANGVTHPAKDEADPRVLKPRARLEYDETHFTVDPVTNKLQILLDGEQGAFTAGSNIWVMPGSSPSDALDLVMTSGGSIEAGPHRWGIAWRVKLHDGTHVPTGLSTPALGVAGSGYNSAHVPIPAVPAGRGEIDGIYVVRTKADDLSTYFIRATLTSGLSAPQLFIDSTSDTTLGDEYAGVGTTIAVQDWILQTADPPSDPTIPSAPVTVGPYGQRTPLAGFTNDAPNAAAYHMILLDENAPTDAIVLPMRKADGTFPASGFAGWLSPDYAHPPVTGDHPGSVNLKLNGYVEGAGGIVTVVLDHSPPVDADVAVPIDGMFVFCSNDNTEWVRIGGVWRQIGGGTVLAAVISVSSLTTRSSGSSITFDTNTLNHGFSGINLGTSPTHMVIPANGTYSFHVEIEMYFDLADGVFGHTGDRMYIEMFLNGVGVDFPANWFDDHRPYNNSGGTITNTMARLRFTGVQDFSAGDVITIPIHYAGCYSNVKQGDCWISIHKV